LTGPHTVGERGPEPHTPGNKSAGDPRHLSKVERRHVQTALHEEKGNKVQSARVLGISCRSLYRLIEKYQLE
jgi:DNA-binding NtrC family response regulator